ncbi:MAG: hypothetical protein AB7T49_05160 [Oligoflexales bacterium]
MKLVKLLATLALSLAPIHAFAQGDFYEVKNNEITEIDVAGQDIITLRGTVIRPVNQSPLLLPQLTVEETYGDFECTIGDITFISTSIHGDATFDIYEVKVSWAAGTDSSGCKILFFDPYTLRESRAHLYMNY